MESQGAAPKSVRGVVNFLRTSNGPKTKVGVLNGKRHDYFKGTGAVKALLSPAYQKASNSKNSELPKITNEKEAAEFLHTCIPFTFFLRVDRSEDSNSKEGRPLQINQMQMFKSEFYYAWFYEGSQLMLQLSGIGMILLMLAGVMFPLWPTSLRIGVWYLSIGMLGLIGLFFLIAILRLIIWCITVITVKPGIWIFPNLFEDVGFVDSFIPFWAWDIPPPSKKKIITSEKAATTTNASPKIHQGKSTSSTTATPSKSSTTQQRLPEQTNETSKAQNAKTSSTTTTTSDNLAGLD